MAFAMALTVSVSREKRQAWTCAPLNLASRHGACIKLVLFFKCRTGPFGMKQLFHIDYGSEPVFRFAGLVGDYPADA